MISLHTGSLHLHPLPEGRQRRRWTADELAEILDAAKALRTDDIARTLGVHPKALRSVLRRNGISLRVLREPAKKQDGLIVRRSSVGSSAVYGALALERLPANACRWPTGDPAEPDFAFCGARKVDGRSYCTRHLKMAYNG